jgi:hypothetical protein
MQTAVAAEIVRAVVRSLVFNERTPMAEQASQPEF